MDRVIVSEKVTDYLENQDKATIMRLLDNHNKRKEQFKDLLKGSRKLILVTGDGAVGLIDDGENVYAYMMDEVDLYWRDLSTNAFLDQAIISLLWDTSEASIWDKQ